MVKLLLSKGASIDLVSEGCTALNIACHAGQYDVCKYLIQAGANVNICNVHCESTLHGLITSASCDPSGAAVVARMLIHAGIDLSVRDSSGHSAVEKAALGYSCNIKAAGPILSVLRAAEQEKVPLFCIVFLHGLFLLFVIRLLDNSNINYRP